MVNFHKKLGGDTAGTVDPNWSDKQGIQDYVTSYSVLSRGAGREEVNCGSGVHWALDSERELLCVFPCSYQYCCCYCSICLLFC